MISDLIDAQELSRRFRGLSQVGANRLMRRLPHMRVGRHRYTTEPWLAGWMASQVKHPPMVHGMEPLDRFVIEGVVRVIEKLVAEGKITVAPQFNNTISAVNDGCCEKEAM